MVSNTPRSYSLRHCSRTGLESIYTAVNPVFLQLNILQMQFSSSKSRGTCSSPKTRNTSTPSTNRHGKAQSCPAQSVTRCELGLPTEAWTLISAQGHWQFDDEPFSGKPVLCNWIALSCPVRSPPSSASQGTSSSRSESLRPAAQTSLFCVLQE